MWKDIVRAVGSQDVSDVSLFIANTLLLHIGAPIWAVVNYTISSRLLYYIPYLSPIHPGRVCKLAPIPHSLDADNRVSYYIHWSGLCRRDSYCSRSVKNGSS